MQNVNNTYNSLGRSASCHTGEHQVGQKTKGIEECGQKP